MKTSITLFAGLLFALFTCSSCNQEEPAGHLKFGLELQDDSELKAASVDDQHIVAALVTIMNEYGNLVFDKEPLELIRFGDQFVTRSLELPVGKYMLTEFMLTDTMGVVVWATPMVDSRLAHLVDSPLPQSFGIHPDETTSMDIQVIRVGNYSREISDMPSSTLGLCTGSA